jgi:hypothetical protein
VLRVAYGRIEVLDRGRLMEVARVSLNERRILHHLQPGQARAQDGV